MLVEILSEIFDKLEDVLVDEQRRPKKGLLVFATIAGFLCAFGVIMYGVVMVRDNNDMGWVPIFLGAFMAVVHTGIVIYRICKATGKRKKQLNENDPT